MRNASVGHGRKHFCTARRTTGRPSGTRRPVEEEPSAVHVSHGSCTAGRWHHHDLRFTGEYRRELDNITFFGERAAAEKTVETYAVYQRDDRKIRALLAAGKEDQAVEFCMDWEPGTSNAHFSTYMAALDKLTDINRDHFTVSVREGRSTIGGLLPWAAGLLLGAIALTALGLRPRLAEFR